jgi:hypothetical protein
VKADRQPDGAEPGEHREIHRLHRRMPESRQPMP